MSRTDITAINAKTISVNSVPIAGSATAYGPYTTFDQLDADVVLALNGTVIQGVMAPSMVFTNIDHVNVLSGVSLGDTVKYGSASTPGSNAGTGPLNPGGGGSQFSAPQPVNFDFIFFGDSRTENGVGANLNTNGYSASLSVRGAPGWIGPLSGNRLRTARNSNFGISTQGLTRAALNPRGEASSDTPGVGRWYRGASPGSGSSNKGYVQAGQHPAGNVVLLMGTNGGSFADLQTIVNGILATDPTKVIWLMTELPRGVGNDGTILGTDLGTGATAINFAALHANMAKLDYASGDPLANPRVVAVDTWTPFLDATSGAPARNKAGLLTDGLHPNPPAGKLMTQTLVDKAAATIANYASLPALITPPTASGLTALANAQPYINVNPTLKVGTPGVVAGTWAVTPVAANVPQGWTLSGTNVTGMTCDLVSTDGYWKLTLTGTLATTSAIVLVSQTTSKAQWDALVAGGNASLNDKLRMMSRRRIAAGSQRLVSVTEQLVVFGDVTAKNISLNGHAGFGTGTAADLLNNGAFDIGDPTYRRFQTEIADLAEPGYVSDGPGAITAIGGNGIQTKVSIGFDGQIGDTVSAVIEFTEIGTYRSAS